MNHVTGRNGPIFDGQKVGRSLIPNKVDIAFIVFSIILAVYYQSYISSFGAPIWDGAVYLENAENWMNGEPLFEPFRPQLMSLIISGIWLITGENWMIIKYMQAAFTIGAGIVLYLTLREHKGRLFAFGVAALTMLNMEVFWYSTQIYSEGLALFFLVLTLYFLKKDSARHWLGGGITMGLTFVARYPIILQAMVIFFMEAIIRRNHKLFMATMFGAVPVVSIIVVAIFLKAGAFDVSLDKDNDITFFLSPFYIVNSLKIWGFAILLVPIALAFRRTYRDKYNYTFIAWFLVSLLFWSANASNHQERFAIQYTPAVYYLAMLAIENIVRSKFTLQRSPIRSVQGKSIPPTPDKVQSKDTPIIAKSEQIPLPDMPGFYRKKAEPYNIIYEEGFEDRLDAK